MSRKAERSSFALWLDALWCHKPEWGLVMAGWLGTQSTRHPINAAPDQRGTELLAEPVLAGMRRAEFGALIERVLPVLAAPLERRRHRKRAARTSARAPGAGWDRIRLGGPAGSPDLDRTAVLAHHLVRFGVLAG